MNSKIEMLIKLFIYHKDYEYFSVKMGRKHFFKVLISEEYLYRKK